MAPLPNEPAGRADAGRLVRGLAAPEPQVRALVVLGLGDEALGVARLVEDGSLRARLLAMVAEGDPRRSTAGSRSTAKWFLGPPADLIGDLVPVIRSRGAERRLEAYVLAVRAFGGRPRRELLRAQEASAPIVASLGRGDAIADVADAVVRTGRWFPWAARPRRSASRRRR